MNLDLMNLPHSVRNQECNNRVFALWSLVWKWFTISCLRFVLWFSNFSGPGEPRETVEQEVPQAEEPKLDIVPINFDLKFLDSGWDTKGDENYELFSTCPDMFSSS